MAPAGPQVAGAEKSPGLPEGSPSSRDKVLQPEKEVGFQTLGFTFLGNLGWGHPQLCGRSRDWVWAPGELSSEQLGTSLSAGLLNAPAGNSDLCPVLESNVGRSGFSLGLGRKRGQGRPGILTQSPRLKGGACASVGACSWRERPRGCLRPTSAGGRTLQLTIRPQAARPLHSVPSESPAGRQGHRVYPRGRGNQARGG